MNPTYFTSNTSILPPTIRTVLQERRGYHKRFFLTFLIAIVVLLLLYVFLIWTLWDEKAVFQLAVSLTWLALLVLFGCLAVLHRRRKRTLDNCLLRSAFSVVKGTLEGIQRLRWKRVRYFIDKHVIEGELVFPGFTAFQNTRVIDVITAYQPAVELYLLPNGLIAGAIYPELDAAGTIRPVSTADWKVASQELWGGVKLFAYIGLFLSLLVVAISWFMEYKFGNGWGMLGEMLIIFNGILLSLLVVYQLVGWPLIRALTDKYHPSVHIQVYQGISAEWYLTGTRYGESRSTTFGGWIRMAGALHRIQGDDVFSRGNDPLEPLKIPTQLEYLVYKGRMILLQSTVKNQREQLSTKTDQDRY